jgi:hypothetical protein
VCACVCVCVCVCMCARVQIQVSCRCMFLMADLLESKICVLEDGRMAETCSAVK